MDIDELASEHIGQQVTILSHPCWHRRSSLSRPNHIFFLHFLMDSLEGDFAGELYIRTA